MINFSVIIPTYNRPDQLAACLQSFLTLDYPDHAWELILVNDGGGRSFSSVTDSIKDQLPLTLIDIDHGGPAKARNAGVKAAGGDFVAFTDDDCRVDKNWLKAFEEGFAQTSSAALCGKILNPYPDNQSAKTWSLYMDFLREEEMRDKDQNLLLLISNNSAYRRVIFVNIGGFDESFPFAAGEDSEIGYRMIGNGYKQVYWPDAIIWHDHKNSYWGYLRQQFRYGRGNYYFQNILTNNIDYPLIEQQDQHLISFMRRLLAYSENRHASLPMKLLLFATPFFYKLGSIFEILSVRLKKNDSA